MDSCTVIAWNILPCYKWESRAAAVASSLGEQPKSEVMHSLPRGIFSHVKMESRAAAVASSLGEEPSSPTRFYYLIGKKIDFYQNMIIDHVIDLRHRSTSS